MYFLQIGPLSDAFQQADAELGSVLNLAKEHLVLLEEKRTKCPDFPYNLFSINNLLA